MIALLDVSLKHFHRHLVLAAPPDVPAKVELLLGQLPFAQQVVELVHRKVHNVLQHGRTFEFDTG